MTELRVCPFCGSVDCFLEKEGKLPLFFVFCPDCCVHGPYSLHGETAMEGWNGKKGHKPRPVYALMISREEVDALRGVAKAAEVVMSGHRGSSSVMGRWTIEVSPQDYYTLNGWLIRLAESRE